MPLILKFSWWTPIQMQEEPWLASRTDPTEYMQSSTARTGKVLKALESYSQVS